MTSQLARCACNAIHSLSTRLLRLRRLARLMLLIGVAVLLAGQLPQAVARAEGQKPFILPFKDPPGPSTWLLGQAYGNTTGAYTQRDTTYAAVQGLHFGVDFSTPCGTALVAMADGVVFAADDMKFGSAPHNLMIDHPDLGYATFYGHLLKRPDLQVGQQVKAGEVVALSGDPEGPACNGRPHLHLEIRDLRHVRKYNPILLVQADWDNLALVGSFSQGFERNLDNPRQWQYLDDQPETVIGGPLLNDYAHPWPPDRRRR
jgi:murein DD-endopeptidase MepM/ murein hydrolase activator NlpD